MITIYNFTMWRAEAERKIKKVLTTIQNCKIATLETDNEKVKRAKLNTKLDLLYVIKRDLEEITHSIDQCRDSLL